MEGRCKLNQTSLHFFEPGEVQLSCPLQLIDAKGLRLLLFASLPLLMKACFLKWIAQFPLPYFPNKVRYDLYS